MSVKLLNYMARESVIKNTTEWHDVTNMQFISKHYRFVMYLVHNRQSYCFYGNDHTTENEVRKWLRRQDLGELTIMTIDLTEAGSLPKKLQKKTMEFK